MISYSTVTTPLLGDLLLIADPTKLIGVYFLNRKHAPAIQSDWKLNPRQPVLKKAADELKDYLRGKRKDFSIPLHSPGTPFQQKVWRQIAMIPFGKTLTYSDLARRVGSPRAIRAAGTATGKNPLSVIVPCHRVVAKDGKLGGYAGGLDRKKQLLAVETTK